MVVTGQQVGYLGGPLYTFLKAYHTTRLAAQLERELKIPVLACFWLEGEDHDLEEVRHSHYLTRDGELKSLKFSPAREISNAQVGMYDVDASEQLSELAASVDALHAGSLELLKTAYIQTTLSDGMGRLLARTLGARGLFVIEGMEPELKAMALPLWEKILERGRGLAEILEERSVELRASGWNTPLTPTRDAHLFYLSDEHHVRRVLSYDGKLRQVSGEIESLNGEQLLALVRQQPSCVSPKAALRPLFQDFVLPTIAYIAGPGELDYHAQLAPFYRELGVVAPVLYPRLSATVMDVKTARAIEKSGISIERLLSEERSILERAVLSEADDAGAEDAFASAKRQIENAYGYLKSVLNSIDPTLDGAAQTSAGKSLLPLEQLREKAQRALKQKHAVALSRLEKCLGAVKPRGEMSERVLGTAYYLVHYGTERLLAAWDELPVHGRAHAVITIS